MKLYLGSQAIKNKKYFYFREDQLKIGKLVGVDKFGNKYYENDKLYFYGKPN